MRQQQLQSLAQQMVTADDCDFGIEPLPDTRCGLDFVLDGHDWHPAVVLSRLDDRKVFVLRHLNVRLTHRLKSWQEGAHVLFLQEDPTVPDVFIAIRFRGRLFELLATTDDLQPFMEFPYELSVGRGFWSDFGTIKEINVL